MSVAGATKQFRQDVTVMSSAVWRTRVPIGLALLAVSLLVFFLVPYGDLLLLPFLLLDALVYWLFSPGARTLTVQTTDVAVLIGDRRLTAQDVDAVAITPGAPVLQIALPGETLTLDVPLEAATRIRTVLVPARRPLTVCRTFTVACWSLVSPGRTAVAATASVCAAMAIAAGVGLGVDLATAIVAAPLSAVATLVLAFLLARGTLARTQVTVGNDGVLLRNGAVSRFLPRRAITEIREGLTLVLGSDEILELRSSGGRRRALWRALQRMPVRSKDQAATEAEPGPLATVEPAKWIDALRRQTAEASYRTAPVEEAVRWRIAEDATASAERRAAAAIAVVGTPEARTRLRVIAGAVADPELRAVLDAVAAEEQDALVDAVSVLKRGA